MLALALIAAVAAQSTWEDGPDLSVNRSTRAEREYTWSVGLVTKAVSPIMGSAGAWDPSPALGMLFEFSTRASNLSLGVGFDRSRHHLIRGDRYLPELTDGAGAALEGDSVHWNFRGTMRWTPGFAPSPVVPVRPYLSAGLGVDLARTELELPALDGRLRTGSQAPRPAVGPGFGVLLKPHQNLHVALDSGVDFVVAFNSSEVQGADTMETTGRLRTGLELLGRF